MVRGDLDRPELRVTVGYGTLRSSVGVLGLQEPTGEENICSQMVTGSSLTVGVVDPRVLGVIRVPDEVP